MDFYLHFILTSQSISDKEFAESDAFRYESDVFGKKYPPRLTGAFVIYKMKRDMSWLPAMSERQ